MLAKNCSDSDPGGVCIQVGKFENRVNSEWKAVNRLQRKVGLGRCLEDVSHNGCLNKIKESRWCTGR